MECKGFNSWPDLLHNRQENMASANIFITDIFTVYAQIR